MRYFRSSRIGLDLGSANTLIYRDGLGIALNEPSLVRVRTGTGEIDAVGREVALGAGRTPPRYETAKPVRGGAVADRTLCEGMLRQFFRCAGLARTFSRIRIAVAVPAEGTEVERRALLASLRNAGAEDVIFVGQALAAARGEGIAIDEPRGRLVVDIGAGTTEIALLSLSQSVHSITLPVAGNDMDARIAAHVRARHRLLIGERTAERVKMEIGSALPLPERLTTPVKGRCEIRGVPRQVRVCDEEIRDALSGTVEQIVAAIRPVLEITPGELSADLVETGILLTGGSALLRNLGTRIRLDCGLPVRLAEAPFTSVVRGLGHQLENLR